MTWTIRWFLEAQNDFLALEKRQQLLATRAVQERLMVAPDQYGEPCRDLDQIPLEGTWKLRLSSLRIVYLLSLPEADPPTVVILAIGARSDKKVYKKAAQRITIWRKKVNSEAKEVEELLHNFFVKKRNK